MSNLRLIGLVISIIGIISTFLFFRGTKWKKSGFVLFFLPNLALLIISINPDSINFLRDIFFLQTAQHGRLIALLIVTVIFLIFYTIYTRLKSENLRLQFDKLIRKLGIQSFQKALDKHPTIEPIMIIIPAYNEEKNLEILLPNIPKKINDMDVGTLIIDDGSHDNTINIAQKHDCLVVSNIINRGQGAASRLGYDMLLKYNVSIGVTMDADNQHRPEDIEALIKPILEGHYDLVIGSRMLGSHEKESAFRSIGVIILSKIISLITGLRITDCSSGFKAFNVKKIKDIHLTEDQFQAAEVLIEAAKKGLKIGEVPITINRRAHGKSKKGRDIMYGINFAKVIVKTWWR